MSHVGAFMVFDPNALPVPALVGICAFWLMRNVHEGVYGICVMWRRWRAARRVRRALAGYLVVTGAPLRSTDGPGS